MDTKALTTEDILQRCASVFAAVLSIGAIGFTAGVFCGLVTFIGFAPATPLIGLVVGLLCADGTFRMVHNIKWHEAVALAIGVACGIAVWEMALHARSPAVLTFVWMKEALFAASAFIGALAIVIRRIIVAIAHFMVA